MLHDKIVEELFQKKSLAALIWLVQNGRELEFCYKKEVYFLLRYETQAAVSIWHGKEEQAFENIETLLEQGLIAGKRFIDIWNEIECKILF